MCTQTNDITILFMSMLSGGFLLCCGTALSLEQLEQYPRASVEQKINLVTLLPHTCTEQFYLQ